MHWSSHRTLSRMTLRSYYRSTTVQCWISKLSVSADNFLQDTKGSWITEDFSSSYSYWYKKSIPLKDKISLSRRFYLRIRTWGRIENVFKISKGMVVEASICIIFCESILVLYSFWVGMQFMLEVQVCFNLFFKSLQDV